MFLRRAGIHLIIFPSTATSSLSTSTSAASKIAASIPSSVLSFSSVAAFQDETYPNAVKFTPSAFTRYGREFMDDSASPSSRSLPSEILGTTMMMGANKCKNYHRDHHFIQQNHQRHYHHLHLQSSSASVFSQHLVSVSNSRSNNNSNFRHLHGAKSAKDHNNWPFSRRSSSSCSHNGSGSIANFSTKSSNVSFSDGGGDGDGGPSSPTPLVVTIKDGLSSRESADDFLAQLSEHQKHLIYHTLNIEVLRNKYEGTLGSSEQESHHYLSRFGRPATQKEDPTGTLCEVSSKWLHQRLDEKAPPAPASAIWAVMVKNALPFIGFGFLDNLIMILAGDYIDITIGTALGISTMAAAALGNAISDVAGIGSAWYVEELASKVGIRDPDLTPSQMASGAVRWASNFGRAFGVLVGCLLGMFPLLFLPSAEEAKERKDKREEEERQKKKAAAEKESSVDKSKFH